MSEETKVHTKQDAAQGLLDLAMNDDLTFKQRFAYIETLKLVLEDWVRLNGEAGVD